MADINPDAPWIVVDLAATQVVSEHGEQAQAQATLAGEGARAKREKRTTTYEVHDGRLDPARWASFTNARDLDPPAASP